MKEIDRHAGWWAPGEIIFLREQVEWLLQFLSDLEKGNWPSAPNGVLYKDHTNVSRRGYFEAPIEVYSELMDRLKLCGIDGAVLADYYANKPMSLMCLTYQDKSDGILYRKSRALRYVIGPRRKQRTYKEFCNHRREGARRRIL